ncbi:hypothetical protein PX699_22620 [Sphingobium sp. H39-3-25]|uniref:hypothetical protein n=1 Tax=Sphingomonadales TaxID=204457 RepID=UPI0008295CCB|nr:MULTISPECIES: hypothetical protein [Sphingomonadaceae]MDF0491117.1 hypothetical protein [Sphingomonas pollutisoli]MDF0545151.1 hypothetical protein [Sphingobium arseniciresistens]
MNGLISAKPSQTAIRLAFGGFLLLLVQSLLLLLVPGLDGSVRLLVWVLTPIALVAFVAALVGLPDPPAEHWRRRHGR